MSPISCHSSAAPAMKKIFSVSDFIAFGERYGIDYRFPALPQYTQSSPVLHGDIEEIALPGGICITRSDVHVLQPYETTSRHSSPLYMLVVLEGNVALAVNEQTFLLSAGMAFCSQLSEQQTIRAHHGADSKLRTLSLGMYRTAGGGSVCLSRWQTSGNVARPRRGSGRCRSFCFRGYVMRSSPDLMRRHAS